MYNCAVRSDPMDIPDWYRHDPVGGTNGRLAMIKFHFCVAVITAVSITAFMPAAAGPIASLGAFDVCSLLSSGEASSITGDQNVVQRGGVPGFMCSWNSPPGKISHAIAVMFFTPARIQQIKGTPSGFGKDAAYEAAFRSGSPLGLFQGLSKAGKSCQGYSGNLPCTEVEERMVLYKHTNAYDYVVVFFAQRDEGHGDAGIVRLVVDAAHVANHIASRLP